MLSFKILCQIIFAFYLLTKNNLSLLMKLQFIFSDFLNYSMAFAFSLLLPICLGTSRGKNFIVLLWDQKSDLSLGWFMGGIFCSVLMYFPRLKEFISFLLIGVTAAIPSLISTHLIISLSFFLLFQT